MKPVAFNPPINEQTTTGLYRQTHVVLDFPELSSLDDVSLESARRQLLSAAAAASGNVLRVELRTKMIGAAFVGVLAIARATVAAGGGQLLIDCDNALVNEVLTVCGYGAR